MIYELRTYTLKPGSVAEVEKRYGEAYEYRKKYSPLFAFWHTEVGPLNQICHIWPYQNLAERDRIRAEAAKDANWPPKIQEFIVHMESEVLTPVPLRARADTGHDRPDLRDALLRPQGGHGAGPEEALGIEDRRAHQALARRRSPAPWSSARRTGSSTSGPTRAWTSGWPIRNKAREMGVWPPPGGGDTLLTQENKIFMPSAFSPIK